MNFSSGTDTRTDLLNFLVEVSIFKNKFLEWIAPK